MRILTVVGARPQFIKAAAVSRVLRASHHETLLHTGQHYDEELSGQFFQELSLPTPDIALHVGSLPHGEQTALMLSGIERAVLSTTPDCVLVYGDTNSTLAGALAAAKQHVRVAHVEAGLRSFNRRMPEEINRVVTDQLASVLFCPSAVAAANLAREGIDRNVHVVGDVMADAVKQFAPTRARAAALVAGFGVSPGEFVLATVHRAENTDEPARLRAILKALGSLNDPVVFPAHPRVRRAVEQHGLDLPDNVKWLPPVGYVCMLALVRSARAVLTDSGGLQKEAYWLGVPCVTLREETEWVETVEARWNHLVGADTARIVDTVKSLDTPLFRPPLYGEGSAAKRIVSVLASDARLLARA